MRYRTTAIIAAIVLILGFGLGAWWSHEPEPTDIEIRLDNLKADIETTREAIKLMGGARNEHTMERLEKLSLWLDKYEKRMEADNVHPGPIPQTALPGG